MSHELKISFLLFFYSVNDYEYDFTSRSLRKYCNVSSVTSYMLEERVSFVIKLFLQ